MFNFYHKFIPRLADVAAPLKDLRKKAAKFKWGVEQQQSFDALKKAIAQPPVLRKANISKKFILQTGASGIALGRCFLRKLRGICSQWPMPLECSAHKSEKLHPSTNRSVWQHFSVLTNFATI
jgi:hypothetical protein